MTEQRKLPGRAGYPLLSKVAVGLVEGVVIARSFTDPMRYDVRHAEGVLRDQTDVRLIERYSGPPIQRV